MNNNKILYEIANQARGLAIDAVGACKSGHLGLPFGSAEIGAALFGHVLRYHPDYPKWLNRDRFILSAGHGSMFLYAWLHLAGYNVSINDIKNFRQLNSNTPGHPEFGYTDGVEATTGPLGQGVGNAVGYALSAKISASKYNTSDNPIFDQTIYCLAGDGCLQEGVASEAISFAGHNGLDNLILIYDSNDVTLDAKADVTQSYDACLRFKSFGWDAVTVDGHDIGALIDSIEKAKANKNGKPTLIEAKTCIGKGIKEVEGTALAHGESGASYVKQTHVNIGISENLFEVSDTAKEYFLSYKEKLNEEYSKWEESFNAWSKQNEEKAKELKSIENKENISIDELISEIPEFDSDYKGATRAAGGEIIQHIAKLIPNFITGSADLFGSTKNYIKSSGDLTKNDFSQKNIWYGIREHAMGAICNGFAYDGIFKTTGATFAVFADYLRPAIRLAALSHLPVGYIFTHDSVGVGEDGPTHQPVETVSGLRLIPNLDVIRPADGEETAGAFIAMVERNDGPTALCLTRQGIPSIEGLSSNDRRQGVLKGAYIVKKEKSNLDVIIIATGSELQHAIKASEELGDSVRVVSMPCMERFERQTDEYKESVFPSFCEKRVSIEAGVTDIWWKYLGIKGKVIGIDRFGMSAAGDIVMSELNMTSKYVVDTIKSM